MAKLTRLLKKIEHLEMRLEACTQAYTMLLNKHMELKLKYSYEETMEEVKKISEKQKIEGKNLL